MARNGIPVLSGKGDLPICLTKIPLGSPAIPMGNDLLETTINQ